MNHKAKGECTEAILIAEFIKKGYRVSVPFGDNQRYDLVVEMRHGILARVQCKTAHWENEKIVFSVSSIYTNSRGSRRVDYQGQVDYFAVHCYETGKSYLIPISVVGKTDCTLRLTPASKKNGSVSLQAKDYEIPGL